MKRRIYSCAWALTFFAFAIVGYSVVEFPSLVRGLITAFLFAALMILAPIVNRYVE